MPIYNKDGSLFKLSGINPLMLDQDRWIGEKFSVHFLEGTITESDLNYSVEKESHVIVGVGPVEDKLILYCKPYTIIETEDPLYGVVKKFGYGAQFTLEGLMVEGTGLSCVFYITKNENMPEIPEESIIFVYKERQWWKVVKNTVSDGIYLHCVISQLKPSFDV